MTDQDRAVAASPHSALWICASLSVLHCVLLALAVFSSALEATPLEGFGMTVLVVPYLLHQVGLPVLQGGGASGWGMALPNALGWLLSVVAWLALYGGLGMAVQRLLRR